MIDIGFDIIGDLNLGPNDSFNWENKATSLYCIVAGNVSNDLRTLRLTLTHLARFYQGVFYVPGTLEYETDDSIPARLEELLRVVNSIPRVCMLHQHVATIDGVAIVGINGWNDASDGLTSDNVLKIFARETEFDYLSRSITRLQRHLDIKKIIIVSNAVPHNDLFFKEKPEYADYQTALCEILPSDTERKVSHWVFGSYDKLVDTSIGYVNYVNNPRGNTNPYWAKRLNISVGI